MEQKGMKTATMGNKTQKRQGERFKLLRKFLCLGLMMLSLAFCEAAAADVRFNAAILQNFHTVGAERRYAIEVSVSRKILTLYEQDGMYRRVSRREYRVGTAVLGLDVYPLGRGQVTAISLNPWWHPTAYSREVFRKRGIDLPAAVPPGHPLNYMGAVKISLSHRTRKGAIYRIHGNNNPGRVGRRVTGGCFVMYNEDAVELARTISVGTEVTILP